MENSSVASAEMPDLLTDSSSESDSDEEFLDLLLPAMVSIMKRRRFNRKRDLQTVGLRSPIPKKRGGKVGRTWTQRKRGEIRPEMFGWMRLIAQPDVGDLKSKNGKVYLFGCALC